MSCIISQSLLALHYIARCGARLAVKTDDDYFVDLYGVTALLEKQLLGDSEFLAGRTLVCPILRKLLNTMSFINLLQKRYTT